MSLNNFIQEVDVVFYAMCERFRGAKVDCLLRGLDLNPVIMVIKVCAWEYIFTHTADNDKFGGSTDLGMNMQNFL